MKTEDNYLGDEFKLSDSKVVCALNENTISYHQFHICYQDNAMEAHLDAGELRFLPRRGGRGCQADVTPMQGRTVDQPLSHQARHDMEAWANRIPRFRSKHDCRPSPTTVRRCHGPIQFFGVLSVNRPAHGRTTA